jgi:hypothetical protein
MKMSALSKKNMITTFQESLTLTWFAEFFKKARLEYESQTNFSV